MINTSAAYKVGIVADVRKMVVQAVVDITDPDITYGTVTGTDEASYSQPTQLYDRVLELDRPFATLEWNRWVLNGTNDIVTSDGRQVGYVGDTISDEDGNFSPAVWVQMAFSNVSILQACSIYFPQSDIDGHPVDFTVDIIGDTTHTETITGNTADHVSIEGFTVNNPTAIKVTVSSWNLPYRRMRVCEIIAGVLETWDGSLLASFSITRQTDLSTLSLPYSTCTLSMDNTDRRFDPRNKTGIFKSITERQGIKTYIGLDRNGTREMIPTGTYYQISGGWETADNHFTMRWDLVDIIGLLARRQFIAPSPLPTTLSGWAAALVAQLGTNFAGKYVIDTDVPCGMGRALPQNITCGELLRYVCMACHRYPSTDEDGNLVIKEAAGSGSAAITLGNILDYPKMTANTDAAALIYTIDDNNTQYIVYGTDPSSSNTVSINNPFVDSTTKADNLSVWIFSQLGGNKIQTIGRGDPSQELGDLVEFEFEDETTENGSVYYQTFMVQDGVLQGCTTEALQR